MDEKQPSCSALIDVERAALTLKIGSHWNAGLDKPSLRFFFFSGSGLSFSSSPAFAFAWAPLAVFSVSALRDGATTTVLTLADLAMTLLGLMGTSESLSSAFAFRFGCGQ